MTQTTGDTYSFHLGRKPYLRASLLGYLLIGLSLLFAAASAFLGVKLWPTYTHDFTLYLKWQDALLSMLWFCSFMILVGTIIAVRFLFALRAGYRHGILILEGDRTLTVPDHQPDRLAYRRLCTHRYLSRSAGVALRPRIARPARSTSSLASLTRTLARRRTSLEPAAG